MANTSDLNLSAEDSTTNNIYTVPDYTSELNDAKLYLLQASSATGDNLFDHLSEVLNKVLAERPQNVIDFFEEYSRKVKEQRYRSLVDHLQDLYVAPERYEYTMKIMPMLKLPSILDNEPSTAEPEEDIIDPGKRDLMQLFYYCEKAGVGLPKTEFYYIQLAIKKIMKEEKLIDIRFWGKIYGLVKNYIIVEAELSEEEIEKRNKPPEEKEEIPVPEVPEIKDTVEEHEEGGEGEPVIITKVPRALPPLPVAEYMPPVETPKEPSGEGPNKKVYYVCNEPGEPWVQLPDVTPEQIVVARQIIKHFTGNLDEEVITYPKFPGTEKNYLRAQIARISAGTQISPLGYFTFKGGEGGGEEEEEEETEEEEVGPATKTSYKINKLYEPHALRDLTDMSMSFWVHHTLYILPQGRTKWWNPKPKSLEEDVMEEEGEEEEEIDRGEQPEPETGPALLTPLSEDASLETVPPWSVQCSSSLLPEHAVAIVRSNLWPGAFAFSCGKYFENIYLGYGHKHFATNFSPVPLPHIQEEYPLGPEIMETTDPTAAMEEEWRIAHEKKPPPLKGEGEEMGEEEPEEEEDEDEDDDEDD